MFEGGKGKGGGGGGVSASGTTAENLRTLNYAKRLNSSTKVIICRLVVLRFCLEEINFAPFFLLFLRVVLKCTLCESTRQRFEGTTFLKRVVFDE